MTWTDFVVLHILTLLYNASKMTFVSFIIPTTMMCQAASLNQVSHPWFRYLSCSGESPGSIPRIPFHSPEEMIRFCTISNRFGLQQILKKCLQPVRTWKILRLLNSHRCVRLAVMLMFSEQFIFLKFLVSPSMKVTFCKCAFTELLFKSGSRFLGTFHRLQDGGY